LAGLYENQIKLFCSYKVKGLALESLDRLLGAGSAVAADRT